MNVNDAVAYIQKNNIDGYMLLTQSNRNIFYGWTPYDRGDSANRAGYFYATSKWLRRKQGYTSNDLDAEACNRLAQYEISPGIRVRHPISQGAQEFVTDPARFSRDQQTPQIIALGLYPECHEQLSNMFWAHVKRFGKYQNADFASPQHWGIYVRAFNNKWFYPLLTVLDAGLIVDSVLRLIKRKLKPIGHKKANGETDEDTSDDVCHSLTIEQARQIMPTPASYVARKIYLLSRPQEALDSYFDIEKNAPPLNELIRPLIEQW